MCWLLPGYSRVFTYRDGAVLTLVTLLHAACGQFTLQTINAYSVYLHDYLLGTSSSK